MDVRTTSPKQTTPAASTSQRPRAAKSSKTETEGTSTAKGDTVSLSGAKGKAKTVTVSYLPQDPGMIPVEQAAVPAHDLKDGLVGPRVAISEPRDFPVPHPDADGNYRATPDDPRFDGGQAYVGATRALAMAERYLGRSLPWSFADSLHRDQLLVHPHAGANVANAFYSSESGSLNFFSFSDPKTNEVLRTGESADIVAHETGHAILDAIRHQYIGSLGIAGAGFHESFGDMTAMLSALNNDAVLDRLQADTKGDLRKPNIVSNSAEMLGVAVNHMTGRGLTDALRTGINNYKYADEHFLPFVERNAPNSSLGQEPHAYSNLFTGAFYDIFTGLYDKACADTCKPFKEAVGEARDTAGRMLFRGVEFAPVGDPTYKDLALALIKADAVDNGGANRALLQKVFTDRKIVTPGDLEAFDARQAKLADFKGSKINSPKDVAKFIEKHAQELGVKPEDGLELVDMHTNNKGETFVGLMSHKDFPLMGAEFGTQEGSQARAYGGMLMAYDSKGNILAADYQPITRQQIEDISDHLKVAIGAGAVAYSGSAPQSGELTPDGVPQFTVSTVAGDQGPVLTHSPLIWG